MSKLVIHVLKHNQSVFFHLHKDGENLARSRDYRSICDLEAALAGLGEITSPKVQSTLSSSGDAWQISAPERRERVNLFDVASVELLTANISSIHKAEIEDLRPSKGVRVRISGTPEKIKVNKYSI